MITKHTKKMWPWWSKEPTAAIIQLLWILSDNMDIVHVLIYFHHLNFILTLDKLDTELTNKWFAAVRVNIAVKRGGNVFALNACH